MAKDLSDRAVDRINKDIDDTLTAIDARIAILIAKLSTKDNNLVKMDLTKARETRNLLIKELSAFDSAAKVASTYSDIPKAVKGRIQPSIKFNFTKQDAGILKLLADATYRELGTVIDKTAEDINAAIFRGTLTGSPITDITEEVRQLLLGGTDKAGRSLSIYAKTIAQDRYMAADALVTMQAAEAMGATHFRYSGSLIEDSRPWCREHAGKIYTKEQIEAWEGRSWKGKKAGPPFLVRGGFSCRHYFIPVIPKEDKK